MVDFAKARTTMVDCQIRTVDVTEYDVLDAFSAVPREVFAPDHLKPLAYIDEDILVSAPGATPRYVMEPGPLAKLVQLAEVGPTDRVLDIGSTTGYSAAILSHLAASVVALESDEGLAAAARENLASLGVSNVEVVVGPMEAGLAGKAPFDVILLEGAIEVLPQALIDQIGEGGRIIAVVGANGLAAKATIYTRSGGSVSGRPAFNTSVRTLPGFARPKAFVF
ncbi:MULTISPECIES: protein-L-isoaspartate O-methyltransferase family protein [Kaistia]|uniref:Protein-L-isoaspartate O-methyltransferase n=1 Tax=Kaistia nematophila TaxID=2994654 RepID=A0A9X3DZ21_9HYPH|nr:protein-L-isoaspartate O-methyltransferase [Kaistia nematophila]MBN9025593.1 protein-L-isoaspartate O-methyltransferase [Hyphomicrobiales bacterium]MCX5568485.1 protein-L-isoaspartate O-methyltransferase [Kaistia nematophila]